MKEGLDENSGDPLNDVGFFNADKNIEYGVKYFSYCLNRNNGNIKDALKSYNGNELPNYAEDVMQCVENHTK